MSSGEIALRARRLAAQCIERERLRRAWTPATGAQLIGTRSLFGDADSLAVVQAWKRFHTLQEKPLGDLLNGRAVFFARVFDIGHPPHWHRDPDSGREAPVTYGKAINYRDDTQVGNIKVLWELGRHQHLLPLAVAYVITGDTKYRDHVMAQIDSWVADNPFGMGIHWCSSLEVALRGIAWSMTHSVLVLRDGPGGVLAASSDTLALARSVYEHCYFIRHFLSRYSSANNHLIGELAGLSCLSAVFDFGEASSDWLAFANTELAREAALQVSRHGVAREQATHYQLEVLDYLLFAWLVGRSCGSELDGVVLQRVCAMLRFLRAITPQGGALPQLGDSDEGTVNRFRAGALEDVDAELMATVEHVFAPDPGHVPAAEKGFWYRLIATARTPEIPPRASEAVQPPERAQTRVESFAEDGYAVLAAADLFVVFDAGPLGYTSIAAHGHADALAFCAAWQAQWWLVDPGTYAYHSDPAHRAYFRGTAAHNTVTVDGLDQSTPGGPFMWIRHAPAHLAGAGTLGDGTLWAEGYHDGYRRLGLRHRRRIELSGANSFSIIDRFERAAGRQTRVNLHFHFDPCIEVSLHGVACTASRDGTDVVLSATLDPAWQWRTVRGSTAPLLGWYSPGLGRKVPCWTLQGSAIIDSAAVARTTFTFGTKPPAAGH